MSAFNVNLQDLKNIAEELRTIGQEMANIANDLRNTTSNMSGWSDTFAGLSMACGKTADRIEANSISTTALKNNLLSIVAAYERTETQICGTVSSTKALASKIKDTMKKMTNFLFKTGKIFKGNKTDTSSYDGDPVDMVTGNYVEESEELKIHGPSNLKFVRHYNSILPVIGSMGAGWSHNYEISLSVKEDALTTYWGDGTVEAFFEAEEGIWRSSFGSFDFVETMERGYKYHRYKGDVFVFNEFGALTERKTLSGTGDLSFEYNNKGQLIRVCDQYLNSLSFTYNKNNYLEAVVDHSGRKVCYSYSEGYLITAQYPDGLSVSYKYDDAGRLWKIIGSDGVVRLENRYDEANRVEYQRLADGTEALITYEDDMVCFCDRDGAKSVYRHDKKGRIVEAEYPDGKEIVEYNKHNQRVFYRDLNGNIYKREFDDAGNIISYTDPLGNTSKFTYDKNGNQIGSKVPDCGNTSAQYNEYGQMIRFTDNMGSETLFSYKGGFLVEITNPDGTKESFRYNDKGLLTESANETGDVWHYAYDANGRLILDTDPVGAETRYEYDACDRILKVTNALGQERVHIYEHGRLVAVRDFDGYTEKWKYDQAGRIQESIDKNGYSKFYSYDSRSNVSEIRFPDGGIVKREYDKMGRLGAVVYPEGGRLEYSYDSNGNCLSRNEDGVITRWTYDAMNHIRTMELSEDRIRRYEYDRAGRMIRRILEDGSVFKYFYSPDGKIIKRENPNGSIEKYSYDKMGRIIRKSDGFAEDTIYEYYPDGLLKNARWKDGYTLHIEYDAAGRPVKEQRSGGYTLYYDYDCLGRRKRIKDSEGRVKSLEYDNAGNPVKVIDPLGRKTLYTYSPLGKLISMCDTNGTETRYSYDPMGRLTGMLRGNVSSDEASRIFSNPLEYINLDNSRINITLWGYDRDGRMISRTDALGNTAYWKYNTGKSDPDLFINEEGEKTRYQYNESGRLCSICYEDGKRADYYYNKLGQQTKVSDWTGDFETDFDCYGRLTSVTDAYQSKLTYAMDPAGRTQKMIYPDKREYKYDYDIRGNLSEIKTTGFSVSYQYDDYGRVNEKSMLIDFRKGENADPHSITEQYSYSESGKLMKLIQRSGSNPVAEYNFRYDSLGNVLSRKITEWDDEKSKTEILDYTYDSMNRLTRVTDTSAPDRIETREKYEYDSFGNCIHSLREGVMTENHYNILDQLVSSRIKDTESGEEKQYSYNYDRCGRLTKVDCSDESGCETRRYDTAGHLSSISTVKGTLHLESNSLGHVLSESENSSNKRNFWYDYSQSSMPIIGFSDGSVEQSIVRDNQVLGRLKGEKWNIYLCDEKGTVRGEFSLADEGLSISSEILKYDSFGRIIGNTSDGADSSVGIGYTGLYLDPIAKTWRTASREYSSSVGRFLSRDKDRYLNPTRPETLNLYQYCYNNPVVWVDPEGTDCYIFYKEDSKEHSYTQRRQLAKQYGYDISKVHMIPQTDAQSFEDSWNAMGVENGEVVSIDTVIIESHSNPNVISDNQNFRMSTSDIRRLEKKDMDNLILEGCNTGHLDHRNDNVAAEFARKTNGAPVLAADGTVYYGMSGLGGLLGITFPWTKSWYEPRQDEHFEQWRPAGSKRRAAGWVVYQEDNGTINTDNIGKKKMNTTQMLHELRKHPKPAARCN